MNKLMKTLSALPLLVAASGWSQLTETQMRAFPAPSPYGYVAVKHFDFVGDYQYQQSSFDYPSPNIYARGNGMTYGDMKYFYYSGCRGKHVVIWTDYAGTPPTTKGGCQHTHLEYGIKGKYKVTMLGKTYQGWVWLGGGMKSGDWDAGSQWCNRSVSNELQRQLGSEFGWGQDVVELANRKYTKTGGVVKGHRISASTIIDEIILAGAAPTHGTGDCLPERNPSSGIVFKECMDPFWADAYTVPL